MTEYHVGVSVLDPQGAVEGHPVHRGSDETAEWLEGPLGTVGTEYLCAAPGVVAPSFLALFPHDVAVDGGKEVVAAVVPVHLGCPYGAGKGIAGGDTHHSVRTVPVFQITACEYLHTSVHAAVGRDRVGGAVHVIYPSDAVGEDVGVADVDLVECECQGRAYAA